MNWLTFALFTYAAMALETGLEQMPLLKGVKFVLILAMFVGLTTSRIVVAWSFVILGVLVDLHSPTMVVGPAALAFLVGAYAVIHLRSLVFRESVLTLAATVFTVGLLVHIVHVTLITVRGLVWPEERATSAMDQIVSGFVELIYSAIAAAPIGYILIRTSSIWGFHTKRRSDRRF